MKIDRYDVSINNLFLHERITRTCYKIKKDKIHKKLNDNINSIRIVEKFFSTIVTFLSLEIRSITKLNPCMSDASMVQ